MSSFVPTGPEASPWIKLGETHAYAELHAACWGVSMEVEERKWYKFQLGEEEENTGEGEGTKDDIEDAEEREHGEDAEDSLGADNPEGTGGDTEERDETEFEGAEDSLGADNPEGTRDDTEERELEDVEDSLGVDNPEGTRDDTEGRELEDVEDPLGADNPEGTGDDTELEDTENKNDIHSFGFINLPVIENMWIRKDYVDLYECCNEHLNLGYRTKTPHSVVITGQPGIGKYFVSLHNIILLKHI